MNSKKGASRFKGVFGDFFSRKMKKVRSDGGSRFVIIWEILLTLDSDWISEFCDLTMMPFKLWIRPKNTV